MECYDLKSTVTFVASVLVMVLVLGGGLCLHLVAESTDFCSDCSDDVARQLLRRSDDLIECIDERCAAAWRAYKQWEPPRGLPATAAAMGAFQRWKPPPAAVDGSSSHPVDKFYGWCVGDPRARRIAGVLMLLAGLIGLLLFFLCSELRSAEPSGGWSAMDTEEQRCRNALLEFEAAQAKCTAAQAAYAAAQAAYAKTRPQA